MEERRLLLALALSFLVLLGYRALQPPPPRPALPPAAAPQTTREEPAKAESSQQPVAPAEGPRAPKEADTNERRIEVLGRDVTLAFKNKGARLVSWRLLRFSDARGRPEEMVHAVPAGPMPLDIETDEESINERLRGALFTASSETMDITSPGPHRLRFAFSDGEVEAEKTLEFQAGGDLLAFSAAVRRSGRPVAVRVIWGPGLGNPSEAEKEVQGYTAPQGVALVGGKVERHTAKSLATPRRLQGMTWLGVEAQYFAALWVTKGTGAVGELRIFTGEDAAGPREALSVAAVSVTRDGQPLLLYVGPKDHKALAKLGHQLAAVVPVGDWIGSLVVPMMGLLGWVNGFLGNYGWSIVFLTVLINLVMAPLRHYSIANGMKMAKLAPEMKVIQERYRKVPALDPRRQDMQREMGELYARHGMSMGTQMLVGCLPMLLTLPFLWAIYRVLQISIELRGASFLWIPDLSHKDPLFLTPILMGLSMFTMQKMTPSAMDPAQQRMMMLMPLIFSGMFLWAPAGLNLYWLSSNLCSMIQQGITMQVLRSRAAVPVGAERRRR
jgi:YidC/Oxa1 family membrane protein insertase